MKHLLLIFFIPICFTSQAQDDLMKELEQSAPQEKKYTFATFKGTRLINLHTIETLKKRTLDFRISHRFGTVGSGINGLYGLDGPASIQLHFDYSLTDRLTMGIGRASEKKIYDGLIKYKWLQQTTTNSMPVSVTAVASVNIISLPNTSTNTYRYFSSRVAYYTTLLIAKKINSALSLQLSPSLVHFNLVELTTDKNDIFSVGFSGRYKFTRSMAFTAEYILPVHSYSRTSYAKVLGLGLDIETGGHVFQVFFTNGYAINEALLIPYTTGTWKNREMRLGFNISRVFSL